MQDSSSGIASDDHNALSGNSESSPTLSSFPENSFSSKGSSSKPPISNRHKQHHHRSKSRDRSRDLVSPMRELHSPMPCHGQLSTEPGSSSSRTASLSSQRTRSPLDARNPSPVAMSIHQTMKEFFYGQSDRPVTPYYPAKYPTSLFDLLPDDVMRLIFSCLTSDQKCKCARVCRRWYSIAWDPVLWTNIWINSSEVNVDKAIKVLTKRLSYETPTVCAIVERINLNGCEMLTDKGLNTVARRCPELRHLEVQGCPNITNIALFEVVSNCVNLEHLNVAGKSHT